MNLNSVKQGFTWKPEIRYDHKETVRSLSLCSTRSFSLLHKKVPNLQEYRASNIVISIASLYSKAHSICSELEKNLVFFSTYLLHYLPQSIHKLQENWGSLVIRVIFVAVSDSLVEFVTKAEPFLFDQNLQSADSTVVGIQAHLSKTANLLRVNKIWELEE